MTEEETKTLTTTGNITEGVKQIEQAGDLIDFPDARKTIEGEREVKALILEMLDLQPGASLLDVGSGTGDDAREITEHVGPSGKVVGIDLSEALVAEAKRGAARSSLSVEFGSVTRASLIFRTPPSIGCAPTAF